MPARSNEFQRLVFLVKKLLAPSGATVTESKLLVDRETGDEREVDVCVQTEVSGHPITLCFECRDHKRLADVIWVEQMLAKHQRLSTSALVLVSRSGFSKSARTLAKVRGIDLLAYDKLTEDDLKPIVGLSDELWVSFWELRADRVAGVVPALDDLPSERVRFADDHWVFNHEGKRAGTMKELVSAYLHSKNLVEELARSGNESHNFFVVEVGFSDRATNMKFFVEKIAPRKLRQLDKLTISGRCRILTSRVGMQRGMLGPVKVSWGTTRLAEQEAMVIELKRDGETESSFSLHISQGCPATKELRDSPTSNAGETTKPEPICLLSPEGS